MSPEGRHQFRFEIGGSTYMLRFRRHRPQTSDQRVLPLAPRRAGRTILQVRDGLRRIEREFTEFLAVQDKHLTGRSVPIAGRGLRSWFNFSSSSARARCSRDRTVPIGQFNTKAASA